MSKLEVVLAPKLPEGLVRMLQSPLVFQTAAALPHREGKRENNYVRGKPEVEVELRHAVQHK